MRSSAIALGFLLVFTCAACGRAVDRNDYVQKNLRLLDSLPTPGGAHPLRTDSQGYPGRDAPGADIIGYGTTRTYSLSPKMDAGNIVAFYRRSLREPWQVVDVSAAPSVSLRRGDSYIHVLAGKRRLFVEVDHDCFKGDSSPRCFGP